MYSEENRALEYAIAASIVLHGATTAPVMNRLDRLRERKAVQQHGDEGKAPKTPI